MLAVVMRYWRVCLVLVREGGCEEEKVVVVSAKKCGYTVARRRGDVDFGCSRPRDSGRSPHASRTGSFDRLHWGSTISRQTIRQGIA
jgi:hypothetical protein